MQTFRLAYLSSMAVFSATVPLVICTLQAQVPSPQLGFGRVAPSASQICAAARSARERNSPAAPGLERQCAAQTPPPPSGVGFGRIKPAPLKGIGRVKTDGTVDNRSICEAAADARARNSPAAPGLERQCANAPQTADQANPVTPAGQAAPAAMEGVADLRLSRVYAGGGSKGAMMDDFVELRNRGQTPIDLTGWSLQYASPLGVNWQVFPLSGIIQPNLIFLVSNERQQPNSAAALQFGIGGGKVALVRSVQALAGACPVDDDTLVDFLGYGTANCSFGTLSLALSSASAFTRPHDGCTDTRDNAADFADRPTSVTNQGGEVEACPGQ